MNQPESKQPPFFVIEGSDGTGKTTQADLLRARLEADGQSVYSIKFPRYEHPSGYFVERYLAGDYGTLDEIGPRQASIFFAVDRFAARLDLKAAAKLGQIVVADRYVGSNLAHQGAKIDTATKRKEFFDWMLDFEYELLKVPQPTLNIVLLVEAAISQQLRAERSLKTGIKVNADIHETSNDHQERSRQVFGELCQLFPDRFVAVECSDGNQLKSAEEISRLIYAEVEPHFGPTRSLLDGSKSEAL